MSASLYDKAGELFERAQMAQRALDAYRKGHVYNKAVELARQSFPNEVRAARKGRPCCWHFPFVLERPPVPRMGRSAHLRPLLSSVSQVVPLEAAWGEYLVSQRQLDQAIPHFIEAVRAAVHRAHTPLFCLFHLAHVCLCRVSPPLNPGQGRMELAIEAAIGSRQWAKAAQVVDMQDEDLARPYYKQLADHYAQVCPRLGRDGAAPSCCPLTPALVDPRLGAFAHQRQIRDFAAAEKYYIKSQNAKAAIDMYVQAGKWDAAHKISVRYVAMALLQGPCRFFLCVCVCVCLCFVCARLFFSSFQANVFRCDAARCQLHAKGGRGRHVH